MPLRFGLWGGEFLVEILMLLHDFKHVEMDIKHWSALQNSYYKKGNV